MKYPKIPLAQQVVQLCVAKNVRHVVISPGSRNAPLTQGFSVHPQVKAYSIVDERCAAFFAMGIAQQLKEPVAVVCTSGSALLNYYPAVAEAYYSEIPLLVLSADRPTHLINIGDGQTINQEGVYGKHVCYAANLCEGNNESEVNSNTREINKALNILNTEKGPVHINIPFAEPLYDTIPEFTMEVELIPEQTTPIQLDSIALDAFRRLWSSSKQKMVLVGVNAPESINDEVISFLANDPNTLVLTETTSNLHHPNFIGNIDQLISPLSDDELADLQPELLISIGGLVVSKRIKQFLRKYQPKAHYHIGETRANDTFFVLTHHFNIPVTAFFSALRDEKLSLVTSNYQQNWLTVKASRKEKHKAYVKQIEFCDLKAIGVILSHIPNDSILHLSNSSTIRYAQLFDANKTIHQYCNRGTSGIDGSTSTAVGHAAVSGKQNVLITGDLSFLYDSNALWNTHIPSSFRIIVINNTGGGIFRILPGDKHSENFKTYFETNHNHTAEHLAKMYGFAYNQVSDMESLAQVLSNFFDNVNQPKILEVFTPRDLNDEMLLAYFKYM